MTKFDPRKVIQPRHDSKIIAELKLLIRDLSDPKKCCVFPPKHLLAFAKAELDWRESFCPVCKTDAKMVKHSDGVWTCHGTHKKL